MGEQKRGQGVLFSGRLRVCVVWYEIYMNHTDDGTPQISGRFMLDGPNVLRRLDPLKAQLRFANKKRITLKITGQAEESPIDFDIGDDASIAVLNSLK
jgi:hypothetical protein